jgi:hypothetical protein
MMHKLLFLLAILFAFHYKECLGQNTPLIIHGRILDDSTKVPIVGARVTADGQRQTSESDGRGIFTLKISTHNATALQVQVMGYRAGHALIQAGNNNDTLRLYLKRATHILKEVSVTARKPFIESSVDHITVDPSRYQGSDMANAYNLLKLIPGIQIDANGTLRIHGNNQIRIFIDGKPTLLTGKELVDWMQMQPINTIKNVQVYSAASARLEADYAGGAININLHKAKFDGYQGNTSLGVGTLNNNSGSANISLKKNNVVSSARIGVFTHPNGGTIHSSRQGNNEQGTPYTLTEDGNRRAHDYTISAGYNTTWDVDSTLSLSARLTYSDYKLTSQDNLDYRSISNAPSSNENFNLMQGRITATNSLAGTFSMEKSINTKDRLTVDLLLNRGTNKIDNTFAVKTESDILDLYRDQRYEGAIQAQITRSLTGSSKIEIGGRGVVRTNEANYENFDSINNLFTVTDQVNYKQQSLALYGIHSFTYKKFEMQYGLRAEAYANQFYSALVTDYRKEYINLFPSAAILYNFSDNQTLRFAYSRKTSRPGITYLNNFQDRRNPKDLITGNSSLVPEFKSIFEFEHVYSLEKINFVSSLYGSINNNAIVSYTTPATNNVVVTSFGNIGREINAGAIINSTYNLKKVRLNAELIIDYYNAYNNALNFGNKGFKESLSTQFGYRASHGWYFEASGNFETRSIVLNGTQSGWNYMNFTIEKAFSNKYLLKFLARDAFHTSHFTSEYNRFFDYTYSYTPQIQAFILTFTYKFGKSFKNNQSSPLIRLDDVKEKSLK